MLDIAATEDSVMDSRDPWSRVLACSNKLLPIPELRLFTEFWTRNLYKNLKKSSHLLVKA